MIKIKRIIFHIDVNNAFLSWTAVEMVKTGESDIRDMLAVIGGRENTRHGIVLATSIKAKSCGIKTAEPLHLALKKQPNLKIYYPDYQLYSKVSKELFAFLKEQLPDIEVFSIDECFIDYTTVLKLYGDPIVFAKKIQKDIFQKFGFTVNIGIANNKLCAKMASDLEKPNKIITLFDEEVSTKLYPLAIEKLFGVGPKTSELLKKLGIITIGDLANYNEAKLRKFFKNRAQQLIMMAQGIDDSKINNKPWQNKHISCSKTFEEDLVDQHLLLKKLYYLSDCVAQELRNQQKMALVFGIIIKDPFFKQVTFQKSIKNATNETNEVRKITKALFLEKWSKKPIRLLGVKAEKIISTDNYQLSFFEDIAEKEKDKKLDETIDNLKLKYGVKIIKG